MTPTHPNGEPIIAIIPISMFLDRRLSATEMRVLGAIFSFRNRETGLCSVKRETIAARCNQPLTRVSTTTTSLMEKGWLVKEGAGGFSKSCTYRITIPDFVTVTDSVTVTDHETVTGSVTKTVTGSVTKTVTGSVTGNKQSNNRVRTESFGSRLALTWQPSQKMIDFALQELQTTSVADVMRIADQFRDYWIAKTGQQATKRDWFATWRNWIRKIADNKQPRKNHETHFDRAARERADWLAEQDRLADRS